MSLSAATDPAVPLVALRGVGKIFASGTRALAGLDLDIRPGEFVSLLGPSGCGKSTALRIMAGLSEPTEGAVEWPSTAGHGGKSRLSLVFQEPTLMPWASVFNNVKLPLDLQRAPGADGRPRARGARPCRPGGISPRLSARIVRRHAHARFDRACARDRAGASPDGRAVRGARRDHPLQAQRRSPADVAIVAHDHRVRHAFGF